MGIFGRSRADQALIDELERQVKLLQQMLELSPPVTKRQRELMESGHWRNPATGRLGKKGETFQ